MKRKPVNTEKKTKENPFMFLAAAMAGGTGNAILEQEAAGQSSFVMSDTLPTDYGFVKNTRELLEAAGVKFGEVIEDDPLFQYVELPEGWKKVPTEHSMWSDLVDAEGNRVAAIFYKAAHYARGAMLHLTTEWVEAQQEGEKDE